MEANADGLEHQDEERRSWLRVLYAFNPMGDEWVCSDGEAPAGADGFFNACYEEDSTLPPGVTWDPFGNRPMPYNRDKDGWVLIERTVIRRGVPEVEQDCVREGTDLPGRWHIVHVVYVDVARASRVWSEVLDQVGVGSDALGTSTVHAPFERATSGGCHGRLVSMVETVTGSSGGDGVAAAAQLLHDFNVEYDEPAPPHDELAVRLAELVGGDHVTVLLARAQETGAAIGVAVMRVQPSVWSPAQEAYLAELYVVPGRRGQGYGRELITEAMRVARERGADYAFLVTSEDDRLAQRLYDAAGFRRTEGEGGPLMLAYEREL